MRHELLGHGRKARATRTCSGQGERCDPIGKVERGDDRDAAAHRPPYEVRALEVEDIEERHRVRGQIAQRVRRLTWRIADRAPGIAVIITNDESRASRKSFAELVLPAMH